MKTIIIILVILFSTTIYAENKIPGYLELDLNYARLYNFYEKDKPCIGSSEIKIKYGKKWEYFEPYAFASWKTFFKYEKNNFKKNFPYRDIYGWGAGFVIKIFYFEYEHRCSHAVFSGGNVDNGNILKTNPIISADEKNYLMFEGLPTLSYDSFKVGIKLRVD